MTIVLNGTTGITTPGTDSTTLTVNANNISAVNSLGFRNRIINGNMVIDQRNAGASVTFNDGVYAVDRFGSACSQSSKATAQRSTTAPTSFTNSVLITSSSAYSVTSTDFFNLYQNIEGFNIADLGWGTASAQAVTLSFWVRSSLTGTFGGSISNSGLSRSYPFTYTISAANTFEQKTITIAGDTSGTWLTDNSIGLRVYFGLGVGSTYSGTAGAWAGTRYQSATGATSVVGTNGATFYITGVELEAGSVASPFERRDYGRELAMCQRYYQQFASTGAGGFYAAGVGSVSSSSAAYVNGWLRTTMRTTPSFSYSGTLGTDIKYNISSDATPSSISSDQMNPDGYTIYVNPGAGSAGQAIRLFSLTTSGQFKFSAEL
jgi:hypothetical protein